MAALWLDLIGTQLTRRLIETLSAAADAISTLIFIHKLGQYRQGDDGVCVCVCVDMYVFIYRCALEIYMFMN